MAPWGHPAKPQGFGETRGLSDIWSSHQPWTSWTGSVPPLRKVPPLLYKCIIIDFLLLLPTYKLVGAPSAKEEEGDKLVPLRSAWIWEKLTQ